MIPAIARDRQLPPGVIDAAVASLATFAAGVTGVNLLSATDRGVYGIFFAAFMLGSIIVTQLIYVPSQVVAIAQDAQTRLDGLRRTIFLASGPSIVAGSTAFLAAGLTESLTSRSVLVALTTTVTITIPVSALQDYIRRSLHIAERSWQAATVSGVQLLTVGISIAALLVLGVEPAWIPFSSLAMANIISSAVGLILAGAHRRQNPPTGLTFRGLTSSGKWLVLRSSIPSATAFVAANIVTGIAGPDVYGYAEAARQVAQPVKVLAVGLASVMGPRAIRAGFRTDRDAARRNRRTYGLAVTIAAGSYFALVGIDWAANPMKALIPSAYEVRWLVAATILGNAISALVRLPKEELLGASREKVLVALALLSSPVVILAAATAGAIGAFARPVGLIFKGLIVMVGAEWWLRRHYANGAPDERPPPTTPEKSTRQGLPIAHQNNR